MKAFGKLEGLAYTFEPGELSGKSEELEQVRQRFEAFFAQESGISRLAWKRVGTLVDRRGGKEYLEEEHCLLGAEGFAALEISGELMGLSPEQIYTLEEYHGLLLEKINGTKEAFDGFLSEFQIRVEQLLKDFASTKKLMDTFRSNDKPFLVVFLMECIAGRYTLPGGADTLNLLGAALSRELAAAVYLTVLKEG